MKLRNRALSILVTTAMVWSSAVAPLSFGYERTPFFGGLTQLELESLAARLEQEGRDVAKSSDAQDASSGGDASGQKNADAGSKDVTEDGAVEQADAAAPSSEAPPEGDASTQSSAEGEGAARPQAGQAPTKDESASVEGGAEQQGTATPTSTSSRLEQSLSSVDGHTYVVRLTAEAAAQIPADARLEVTELTKAPTMQEIDKNPDGYKDRPTPTERMLGAEEVRLRADALAKALQVSDADALVWAKYLQLRIVAADGTEVVPSSSVGVEVETDAVIPERAAALETALVDGDEPTSLQVASRSSRTETYVDENGEERERTWSKVVASASRMGELAVADVVTCVRSWELRGGVAELMAPRHGVSVDVAESDATVPEGSGFLPEVGFVADVTPAEGVPDPSSGRGIQLWLRAAASEGATGSVAARVGERELLRPGEVGPVALMAGEATSLLWDPAYSVQTIEAGDVTLSGELPSGATAEASDLTSDLADPAALSGDVARAAQGEELRTVAAYDIALEAGGVSYEPDDAHPVSATVSSDAVAQADSASLEVWRVDGGEATGVEGAKADAEGVTFDASEPGTYVLVERVRLSQTIEASDGRTYEVSVTYGPEAKLPADARLSVRELTDEECADYERGVRDALGGGRLGYLRAFDITITDKDGNKLEPQAEVEASMRLSDGDAKADASVVHFAEQGVEVLDAQASEDAVIGEGKAVSYDFKTGSFSVYAVAYTVDFHWGDYTFNLAGGGEILLSELFGRLGITEVKASDVTKASFSDPRLIEVSPTEDGDWRLKSLAAFDSEESLSLELGNGQAVSIRVTDAPLSEDDDNANYEVQWDDADSTRKYFATLAEVAAEVNKNGNAYNYSATVFVLKDVVETSTVTFSKNYPLTIEGKGNTIVFDSGAADPLITRSQTTDFSMRNLGLSGTASAFVSKGSSGTLTMLNVEMQGGSGAGSLLTLGNTGSARLTNCTLDGGSISGHLIADGSTGALVLKECTVNGSQSTGGVIRVSDAGNVTMTGGALNASSSNDAGPLIRKENRGGGITLTHVALAGGSAASPLISDAGSGTLSVTDCAIDANGTTGNVIEKSGAGAVAVTGGTITGPSAQATGSLVTKTGGAGGVTLRRATLTGGSSTASLVRDAGTGKLLVQGCTVDAGASTGHLVEKASNYELVVEGGTLTGPSVSSNGSLVAKTSNGGGNVSVIDATLVGAQTGGALVSDAGTGTLTVSGCALSGPGATTSVPLLAKSANGPVNVTDSSFARNASSGAAIKVTGNGALTLSGVLVDGSGTDAGEPAVRCGTGVLALSGLTVRNHVASGAGVPAIDASSASSILVSGAMDVSGNTSAGGEANLYIGNKTIAVTGSMAGTLGVSQATTPSSGSQVGVADTAGLAGMDTLVSDANHALAGVYRGSGTSSNDRQVLWGTAATPAPDDPDPVCQLVLGGKVLKRYANLQDALNAAPNGARVEMLKDYALTNEVSAGTGRSVTLTTATEYQGEGSAATITRASSLGTDKRMLNVNKAGSKLTVVDLVVDGGKVGCTQPGAIFSVENGELVLGRGAVLQNGIAGNTNDNGEGGGVYVHGTNAALTMKDGCLIQDCEAWRNAFYAGGGVCVVDSDGFRMEGGTIGNCKAPNKSGGGIGVDHHNTAYISGGLITGCTAKERGAAIEIHGAVDMSGGIITNCRSGVGGAINFFNDSTDSEGADEGRLFLSGNPVIYNNVNSDGKQCNVDIFMHYSGNADLSPYNIWIKDFEGLSPGAHVGVRANSKSAADNSAFGRHSNGVDVSHMSLFTNDVDETLVGSGGGLKNQAYDLVWAKGIRVNACMYVEGHPEKSWPIADATGRYVFDYEGIAQGSTASRTITETIATMESKYRSGQGYVPMVDANPDFVNAKVNATSPDVTFLRSKMTYSGSNRTYTNSYSTKDDFAPFYRRYPDYIQDRYFSTLNDTDTVTLYYKINPRVKITDADGNLLHLPNGNPAVFWKLDTAFERVDDLYRYDEATGAMTPYTDSRRQVKMLVPDYEVRSTITVTGGSDVTLTTASADDEDFPGEGGTCAIWNGGVSDSSLIVSGLSSLTLGNVTLDGKGVQSTADGALVSVLGGSVLGIGDGATLRNGKTSGRGGALWIADGATLNMAGGTIAKNSSEQGGAVNVGGPSARLNFSGSPVVGDNGKRDVWFDQDSNDVIHDAGLEGGSVGVYVIDSLEDGHGKIGMPFGTWDDGAGENLDVFFNDRISGSLGQKGQDGNQVIWTPVYVARVRHDGGKWKYFQRLLMVGADEGAFNEANDPTRRTGAVEIETLMQGNVDGGDDTLLEGDAVGRYTLTSGFTFNNTAITSLTIRTKPGMGRSVLTKAQTASSKTPMIVFDVANSKLTIDSLVLEGGGSAQRTNGNAGLVSVTKDTSSITICNTELKNAEATGQGGAIYSLGTVALTNSRATDQTAFLKCMSMYNNNDGGGAIYFHKGMVIDGGLDASGKPRGNQGTISFEDCTSNGDGGAIASDLNSSSGLRAQDNEGSISFVNCATTGSGDEGGACFVYYGGIVFTNTGDGSLSFDRCVSKSSGGALATWGSGDIVVTGTESRPVTLTRCTSPGGGAVRQYHSARTTLTNVTFGDSDDSSLACTATGSGGAVFVAGTLNYVATDTARIGAYACSATGAGGAFSAGTVNVYTEGTGSILFDGCHANGTGGALNGTTTSVSNRANGRIEFNDCYASNDGGAIRTNHMNMNDNCGEIRFSSCHTNGGSNFEGGAIFFAGAFSATDNRGSLLFSDCYTTGTSCEGGAIHTETTSATFKLTCVDNGTARFDNCRIENANNSGGGAICMWQAGAMSLEGTDTRPIEFTNCRANGGPGGAIYHNSGAGLVLKNVRFGGYVLDDAGSAALDPNGNPVVDQNKACHAKTEGGAVRTNGVLTYTYTGSDEIGVYGSHSPNAGGAIWAAGNVDVSCTQASGTIAFKSCTVTNNNQGGGAIWQNGGSSMTLTNVLFGSKDDAAMACTSKGNGGAVRANGSVTYTNTTGAELGIYHSTTTNMGEGGGIFAQGDVSLSGITIRDCSAKNYGGAVYQNSTTEKPVLYLADCTIQGNTSANSGAGIYSTARTAGFHNALSIKSNTNTQTSVVNAAGLFFTPEDTIVTITGEDGTADITIYDNTNRNTANEGHQSNMKAGIGAPNIEVKGLNANGGLTGKIGIVNPRDDDRWFGRSTSSEVCGEATLDYGVDGMGLERFVDDSNLYFAKYQGVLNQRLIWAPLPGNCVCKITDANGNVLKYDFGEGLQDAVFSTLSDAFGAYGEYAEGNGTFNGTPANIEMLVESYGQQMILYVPDNTATVPLTLKTAESGLDQAQYPYRGTEGTVCTIMRDGFLGSMYAMDESDDFAVRQIVLDGNSLKAGANQMTVNTDWNVKGNQNGGIVRADSAGSKLTVGAGGVLQNSCVSGALKGGAVYMANGGRLSIEEGSFINCVSESGSGGAVCLAGSEHGGSTVRRATFENCAAGSGGGIYSEATSLAVEDSAFEYTNIRRATGSGGAGIFVTNSCEELTVSGSTFKNLCSGTGNNANGGAVYSDAKQAVNVTGSTFLWEDMDGRVHTAVNAARNGGAVFVNNTASTLTVNKSTFAGFRVSGDGAAIYSKGATQIDASDVADAMFSDLLAGGNGGGVYAAGPAVLHDAGRDAIMFDGSASGGSGGAVYAKGTLSVKDLQIVNCKAGTSGNGGGICCEGATALDNTAITACEAFAGGAIYSSNGTANALMLKNGTSITGNKLNTNAGARIQAAGVYMANDNSTITFGAADLPEDAVVIKDNETATGEPSNLRIAMNGLNDKQTSVKVLSELTDEIHIVNPGGNNTDFGTEDVAKSYVPKDHFVSDISNRTAGRREGSNVLYWTADSVCKITDAAGNTLTSPNGIGGDAVYSTLAEAFADFPSISGAKNVEVFRPSYDQTGYEGKPVYLMVTGIAYPNKAMDVTLKTAAENPTDGKYAYVKNGDAAWERVTILRGNTQRANSMFTLAQNASNALTLEEIILDGQSSKSQFTDSNGGAVLLNKSGAALTIRNTAVISNAESIANGGGVYRINGGRITIDPRTDEQGAPIVACKAAYGGGVCDAQTGTVDVTNWLIEGCVATKGGGGIHYPGTVSVAPGATTLTLRDCSALNGGGIYCQQSLTLNGSVLFDECHATECGGGAYTPKKGSPDYLIGDVEFRGCTAELDGGGFCAFGTDTNNYHSLYIGGTVSMFDCQAGRDGGGIYKGVSDITFYENCSVVAKGCHAGRNGGALYGLGNRNAYTVRRGVTIALGGDGAGDACTADGSGGGFFINQTVNATEENIGITAKGCIAGGNGGGLYVGGLNAPKSSVVVTACTAGGSGGGMYSGNVLTTGATFELSGCEATTGSGGGAYVGGALTAASRLVVRDCGAGANGGGMFLDTAGRTDYVTGGAEFLNCTAGGDGGGFCSYGGNTNTYRYLYLGGELTLTNCSAGRNGGGLYKGVSGITFNEGCTLTARNCHARGGSGGALYGLGNRAEYVLKRGSAIDVGGTQSEAACSATSSGGGVYINQMIRATEGDIKVTVTGCDAGNHGGGLYVGGLDSTGASVVVTGCTAGGSGGGMYSGNVLTTGATFELSGCEATTGSGGGAYVGGALTAASRLVVRDCGAGANGGGMFLDTAGRTDYVTGGAEFLNCTAGGDGGGFCSYGGNTNTYRYLYLGGELTLTNCSAGRNGGGLYKGVSGITFNEGCTLTARNCHARGGSGGALYGLGNRTGYTFGRGVSILMGGTGEGEGCSAGVNGGGMYFPVALTLTNDDVTVLAQGCSAGSNGGGVFANGVLTADLSKTRIGLNGCSAKNGGGLYANNSVSVSRSGAAQGSLDAYGLSFTDCSATAAGGGVYFAHDSAVTLSSIPFLRCKAGWDGTSSVAGGNGGGIYKASNNLTLSGVEFTDCYASACGGAIYHAPASTLTLGDGTKITGGTTASGARGSGIYVNSTATVNFNGGTASQDTTDPQTGEVTGSEPVYGVLVTGNRGAGAIEVRNDTGAVLNFSGNVKVQDNLANLTSGEGIEDVQKNVVLSANSNTIIRTTTAGLTKDAYVGVYVIDGANYYNLHGKRAQDFGTYGGGAGNANLECFHNDRNGYWGEVDTDKSGNLIRWYGPLVKITDPNDNLLYYKDASNELKPAVYSTLRSGFSHASGNFFYMDGTTAYDAAPSPVKIKLLDDLEMTALETYSGTRDITLTVAEYDRDLIPRGNGDEYPYTGEGKATDHRAILTRDANTQMIAVNTPRSFIAENLNVDGKGASYTQKTFSIANAADTAFHDMAFVNCKADQGGAIYHNAATNLTLQRVVFGALKDGVSDSDATLLKTTDVDAGKICWSTGYGGAVYTNTAGKLELDDCRFYGSKANYGGGGMYLARGSNETVELRVKRTAFIGCQATGYHGGAICEFYGDSNRHGKETRVEECVFTDCYAKSWSSAMLLRSQSVSISDSTFDNCYSDSNNCGAVSMLRAVTGKVTRCSFKDCHIPGDGGAVGNHSEHGTANSIEISGCEFDNCYSNSGGGAVYAVSKELKVTASEVPDTPVLAGTARGKTAGGAIMSTFTNCRAVSGAGGAIYQTGGTTLLENCTFGGTNTVEGKTVVDDAKACKAKSSGGAVYSAGTGSVTIANTMDSAIGFYGCKVTDNNAEGGAVHSNGAPISVTNKGGGTIEFNSCTTVRGDAGALSGNAQDVTLTNEAEGGQILFDGCRQTDEANLYGVGGAICTHHNKSLIINNQASKTKVSFTNCRATRGGAVWTGRFVAQDNQGEILFQSCAATKNNSYDAYAGGGAVFCNSFTLTNVASGEASFSGCTARTGNGGALCVNNAQGLGGAVTISGTESSPVTFDDCHADTLAGGAIYQVNGANGCRLTDVTFNDCRAKTSGGTVYSAATTKSSGVLDGVSIDGHKALEASTPSATNGGAVYLASGALVIKDGDIRNCSVTAADTGAVHLARGAKVYFEGDAVVYDNFELKNGGNTTQQKNVALLMDDAASINTMPDGIGENAKIGIYVIGATNRAPYTTRGVAGCDFGTYGDAQSDSSENLDNFINDRNAKLVGVAHAEGTTGHLIQWLNGQICKLTKDGGGGVDELLYKDANGRTVAVYTTVTKGIGAANGTLYDHEGNVYAGAMKLKVLGDVDLKDTGSTYTRNAGLTLTTAEADEHAPTLAAWDPYTYEVTDFASQGMEDPYAGIRVEGRGIIARGKADKPMFVINSSGGLVVDNLTIDGKRDTYAFTGNGGAINMTKAATHLSLKDVDFLNHKASNGGAVYAAGNVTLATSGNVSFAGCEATAGGGAGQPGGGGINTYGLLSLTNTGTLRFDMCVASGGQGGAINIDGGKLTLDNGQGAELSFVRCKAPATNGDGGAINAGSFVVTDNGGTVSFTDCVSGRNGGALCLAGTAGGSNDGRSVLKGVTIDGGSGNNAVLGGAVYLASNQLTVIDGDIHDCAATGANGGAINVGSSSAKLFFEGDARVRDNISGTEQRNVVLNQNSNGVINTTKAGLGTDARVGVYVTGGMPPSESNPYKDHGGEGDPFGTWAGDAHLCKFVNDRTGYKGAKKDGDGLIHWMYDLRVTKSWTDDSANHEDETVYYRLYKVTGGSGAGWGVTGSDVALPDGLKTEVPPVTITNNGSPVEGFTWPQTLAWRDDLGTYGNYQIGVSKTSGFFNWVDEAKPDNDGWYFIYASSNHNFYGWQDGPASEENSMQNVCVRFTGRVLGADDLVYTQNSPDDTQNYLVAERGDLFFYGGQYYAMCQVGSNRIDYVLTKSAEGDWQLNPSKVGEGKGLVPVGVSSATGQAAPPRISYTTQEEAVGEALTLRGQGYAVSQYDSHVDAPVSELVGTFSISASDLDASGNWVRTFTDLDDDAWYYAVEVDVRDANGSVMDKYIPEYSYDNPSRAVVITNKPAASFRVVLRKVGPKGESLDGAVFNVCADEAGTRIAKGKVSNAQGAEQQLLKDLRSDGTGVFWVGELTAGTYYLVETQAPGGYRADKFKIVVTADGVMREEVAPDGKTTLVPTSTVTAL